MRFILHASGFGPEYWSFDLLHAVHTYNILHHAGTTAIPIQQKDCIAQLVFQLHSTPELTIATSLGNQPEMTRVLAVPEPGQQHTLALLVLCYLKCPIRAYMSIPCVLAAFVEGALQGLLESGPTDM